MENILILGVNGFIGTYLAKALIAKDYHVVGYDRNLTEENLYEYVVGDFSQEEHFKQILTRYEIDTVYHLIGTNVPSDSTEQIAEEAIQNILPTLRLLEDMRKTGVSNLVFASSGGVVYGDAGRSPHRTDEPLKPICGYGVQKAVLEQYMEFYNAKYGMHCKIARIANPYGAFVRKGRTQGIIPLFFERLKYGQEITLYGETIRDYLYICDLCSALVRFGAYDGDKRILNIGTGIGTGLHALVGLLETTAGRKFAGIRETALRKCDVACNILDICETTEALGWKPETALADGLDMIWKEINGL